MQKVLTFFYFISLGC